VFGFGSKSSAPPAPTTPQTVAVADLAALAALVTIGAYPTGSTAFVVTAGPYTGETYVLQAAIGTADATNIVATSDDGTRQWVRDGLLTRPLLYIGDEVDLAALSVNNKIAPAVTGKRAWISATGCLTFALTAVGGVATGPATNNIGTNVAKTNFQVSSNAVFTAAAHNGGLGQRLAIGLPASGTIFDAGRALLFDVTVAAVGTGAFTYKMRPCFMLEYVP